jgi:hypothetical protein
MNKSLSLIFILAIILISCKEKAETFKLTVKGKVVDYYTGEGIANAAIYIKNLVIDPSKAQLHGLDYFDTSSFSFKVKSDIQGNFDNSFWSEISEFHIVVYDDKVICSDIYTISKDSISILTIRAKRFLTLTINFFNKTKQYDTLVIAINSANLIKQGFEMKILKDTTFIFKKAIPETNCFLTYLFKNDQNVSDFYYITKEIGILDTAKLTIEY